MRSPFSCPFPIACVLTLLSISASAGELTWERVQLDDAFRSEGVAVADVNRDGQQDVIAGDVWYAAPDWTMHAIREVGEYTPAKYSNSFANFAWDVNQDGWTDAIIVGFPGDPFYWYENPGEKLGQQQHWTRHLIWHSICNESPEFEDLDGDGTPEIVFGSQPEQQMGYVAIPPKESCTKKWDFVAISKPGEPRENGTFKYYHGLGVDDVNGDGREDVLIPHGYWEQPAQLDGRLWTFHPWRLGQFNSGQPEKAANIYTQDVNEDGKLDVIMSSAHAHGVWWFLNDSTQTEANFGIRVIDDSYSQTHALERADLDGDGEQEYITGKRYYAHGGRDPGGKDPVVMYYYEGIATKGGPRFQGHKIDAGDDTGVGTQFVVQDMNGDGKPDIVLSNKKGVNILLQTTK